MRIRAFLLVPPAYLAGMMRLVMMRVVMPVMVMAACERGHGDRDHHKQNER